MNKSDLIESISKKTDNFKKSDIEESVNLLISIITNTLQEKKRVEVRGFGTFSPRLRPARLARNPKTGASITISSKLYAYFRPSKILKLEVKN